MLKTLLPVLAVLILVGCAKPKESLIPAARLEKLKEAYSVSEKKAIQLDLKNIRQILFKGASPALQHPIYVATAGGPGALKSTTLEKFLAQNRSLFEDSGVVYTDPDARGLKLMAHTYHSQGLSFYRIAEDNSFQKTQKAAYEKWRNASNLIAYTLLNEAAEKRCHIAHGTTSSSPSIADLYRGLKERGYKIILLLCGASDKTRMEATTHRMQAQANYQATPEDIRAKGLAFIERFPIYLQYADELWFYWSTSHKTGRKLVARFSDERLTVLDKLGFMAFRSYYEGMRRKHHLTTPSFDEMFSI